MAARNKKGFKDSIDDVLGDLLGDDDSSVAKSHKRSAVTSTPLGRNRATILSSTTKKSPVDDLFSQLAKEAEEESDDISEADPQALLDSMKDIDDMDAEIFGGRKPKSAPAKDSRMSRSAGQGPNLQDKTGSAQRGHSAPESEKKPLSALAGPGRPFKKFSFDDIDDPLAGILSDEDDGATKKTHVSGAKPAPLSSPVKATDTPQPSPVKQTSAPRRKDDLIFEGDSDDIMDSLGFGDSSQRPQKNDSSSPRPARSKLDELLGRGTAAKLLERPPTGEKREFKLDPKYQKRPEMEDGQGDVDLAFGSYLPTVASSPEGHTSRRGSVRFSAEGSDNLKPDSRPRSGTPVSRSPARGEKSRADWLGLKDDDVSDPMPPGPLNETARASDAKPVTSSQSSSIVKPGNGPINQSTANLPKPATVPQDDDGWLSAALSRKKGQKQEKEEEERGRSHSEEVEAKLKSSVVTSQSSIQQPDATKITKDTAPLSGVSGSPLPWEMPKQVSAPSASVITRQEKAITVAASLPTEPVRAISQQPVLPLTANKTLSEDDEAFLQAKRRVLDLEAQVRKLQLEMEQQNLLLETLQQRQREDLELIESAHRSRLKLVEDSAKQREERLQIEIKELSAQYISKCHSAEREKSEMMAQYQKKLTEFQQEKETEVERIRELQRMSVQEMCKDHQEQLERLKRLKDQEIDAVTSASSHTRSLNGVIEQMESFSHKLSDLSHRVENNQFSTTQELEIGVRQREGQLKALQERLNQQQREMEEERSSLRTIITNMETRLSEQSRLLEQERWRVSAEQAKVESLQRSLEEQRRVMTQQMAMEREELERAKSALLEEQQSVMTRCADERRKLAAEWSEYHTQQKLIKDRTERDVARSIMVDTQREGAIISLAKEQADLKVQAAGLRSKEEQLTLAQEALEKERQEIRLEKEKVNASALRVRLRAEEIEGMSKLSSQRYEEGEKALREARRIESEHQNRLKSIQQKLEILRQQEESLRQERLNIAQMRRQLNQLQQSLPTAPVQSPVGLHLSTETLQLNHGVSSLIGNEGSRKENQALQSSDLQATLAQMMLHAQQDRNFLEDEENFLETLKKSSWSQTVTTRIEG
ncbi:fas-binding factor 1 [Bombina bombina]|uniref:fas-binding factor 1 n=1 Tax=Bombina bombina TaxID=8345 RepID=UPI00235AF5F0|nr:fas-binding factor 1 [Bombina bombina]